MLLNIRVLLLLFVSSFALSSAAKEDTTQVKKGRLVLVGSTHAVGMGATLYALSQVWYKDFPKTSFHTRSDMRVWNQMDKLGHVYSAYSLAGVATDLYRWTGVRDKHAVLIGSASSLAFLSMIEILDAHSVQWGFSYGDMGANILGAALFGSQELLWKEQRIQLKFSYHNKSYEPYFQYIATNQFGEGLGERILKDYNAQTYWLSVGVHQFGVAWWPKWLNIAAGYGAEQMYGAYYNSWKDANGKYFDANHIPRERQFFIAPDINLSVINTKSKLLNAVFDRLMIKVPMPTIEFNTNGKVRVHALYF